MIVTSKVKGVMDLMNKDCTCNCGCHDESRQHGRRFFTKEEKIERLENYAEELKKELAAVTEKIKDLKS
jgi:archaellum component FlaC